MAGRKWRDSRDIDDEQSEGGMAMELVVGMALGALLGYMAGYPREYFERKDDPQGVRPCYQEAEPLEEQWQRIFNYEGYPSVREDEDA